MWKLLQYTAYLPLKIIELKKYIHDPGLNIILVGFGCTYEADLMFKIQFKG